jgi:hypothetical protein
MKRADGLLLVAIAVASSAWCLTAGRQLGATFDEPFYLEAGLDYWRHGHFAQLLSAGTMPLAPHLQTLPVYLAERAAGHQWTIETDLGEMLQLARPMTLLFWLVLLAFTMRLGRIFGGVWGGRIAVLLIAIEPNFLAHASLATTDIALAACFVAFVVTLLDGRRGPAWRRIGLPGIVFGLALTAKVSALALLPYAVVIAMLRDDDEGSAWWRLALDTFAILVIGLVFAVLYSGTGGQTWLHTTLSQMRSDHWLRPALAWLGSLPLFPNALYAIWFQFAHNQAGQPVFIAGVTGTQSIWFYLPLLLIIKLSLSMMALFVLAIAVPPSRRRSVVVAIALLAATMALFRVQTGIRFLLPLLAVAIAWVGARLGTLVMPPRLPIRPPAPRLRWAGVAVAAVAAAMAVESAFAWPDAIRYVNPLWGGANEGYRAVSDSNYDWGQGLPELARWRRQRQQPLAVWYFGTDTRFPELVRLNPRGGSFDRRALDGVAFAVSTSLLYGGYVETPGPAKDVIQRLRATPPIGRTSTFFIFAGVP